MDWQYWWDLIRILILGFWIALKEIDFFQWLLCRRDRQVKRVIALCGNKKGETCIVTGGNATIGFETAATLAAVGYHVILACRSKERANEAIEKIIHRNKKENKPHDIEYMHIDISSLDSVREFVKEVKNKKYRVTLLINNAGVMFVPEAYSKDGIEMHFASKPQTSTNTLKRDISSIYICVDFTYPNELIRPKNYSRFEAYTSSKLCIQLSTVELVERLKSANLHDKLSVWTVQPGAVNTGIGREFPTIINWIWNTVDFVIPFLLKSPKEGSYTVLYAALSPELCDIESGHYLVYCKPQKQPNFATNKEHAKLLWNYSENLCGINWNEIVHSSRIINNNQ